MFFEGVWAGSLVTADVVARKAFAASEGWIVLLTTLPQVALFSAIYFSKLAKRGEGSARRFVGAGLIGRATLIGVAFSGSAPSFIAFITLSTMMQAYLQPAWNALYQANYAPADRGRRFGTAAAISAATTIGTALLAGYLLDLDQNLYRWIYPVAGLSGFVSCYYFSKIRPRWMQEANPPERETSGDSSIRERLLGPLREAWNTLRENRQFRRFELGYFSYGTALMVLLPVFPIYLVDTLHADYSQAARAKGGILYAMMIFFQPIAGRLMDRSNPVRISSASFAILALFPIPMALIPSIPVAYVSFAIYGIGIAFTNVAWSMGPIYFAGERDASAFMGVHIALVSLRALLGNLLGWFLLEQLGPAAAFYTASALFAAASLLMRKLDRDLRAA